MIYLVILVLLILTTAGGLVVVWYADRPGGGKHARTAPAAEPAPLPAAGRLQMLPAEPDEWWATPDAAAALLAELRRPFPSGPPPAFDTTRTDLPPVTRHADLIARYLP